MSPEARDRLFGAQHAFDHPVTVAIILGIAAVLAITPFFLWLLAKLGRIDAAARAELWLRYRSWLVLTPLIVVPILLGAAWTILGVGLLSLLCYREYARATGLFREKTVSIVVVCGIFAVTLAALDHWYRLFVALAPFTVGFIAIVAILADQPKGYIQRVALGVLGFLLFGACLGNLGYLANDTNYRPILLLILLAVELNDVFGFVVGKTLGRQKLLAPNTNSNMTIAGAVGALVLTTLLVMVAGPFVFAGTVVATPLHTLILGVIISVLGQFGDLMLSSVKRDLGIKDMAATLPGHGGLCDRFDGVILVAPAVFHYLNLLIGIGADQTPRIFTGG